MKKLVTSALLMTASSIFGYLPFEITTNQLAMTKLTGTMTYRPVVGGCDAITVDYEGEIKTINHAVIKLKRTVNGRCGLYSFEKGTFSLNTEDQTPLTFMIEKGKLLNDYAPNWSRVYWGAWVNGECVFRGGEFRSCDAGSDTTWRHDQPFTLYVNPAYPLFRWNITEVML